MFLTATKGTASAPTAAAASILYTTLIYCLIKDAGLLSDAQPRYPYDFSHTSEFKFGAKKLWVLCFSVMNMSAMFTHHMWFSHMFLIATKGTASAPTAAALASILYTTLIFTA